MDKKLEYVKLVFYEDKKNYDNSWGEVYYKLIYGDNQVHRTYKEKITKKEYPLCLRAFRLQEGTDALPFDKYQIYDAKTKKPLNMPYYLKEKTKSELAIDKIKSGLEKTANVIDNGKYKIDAYKRREPKEVDKSLLYSIRGGISDIRGNNRKIVPMYSKKENRRKLMVKITSIATATVLLGALGNYELKKNKIYYSDMVYITNLSNKTNYLDQEIKNDYNKFEDIMDNLLNHNYENISNDDIEFINHYVYVISKASNDSVSDGKFYDFDYLSYLDENSPDYQFFLFYGYDYQNILEKERYNKNNAYEFCAKGCNLLYYTIGALSMNKSTYMPREDDIYSFNRMSPLSKIVFLNQLKALVETNNFSYHRGDEPYWWIGLNMNTNKMLDKIDEMIETCKESLKYDVNNKEKDGKSL